MKPTIEAQVEAARAAALLMCSLWRGQVETGKLTREAADAKCEAVQAAVKTLAWVRDHADVIREAHAMHAERVQRELQEVVE